MTLIKLWQAITRKRVDENIMGKGELVRELNLINLVSLGVGGTLGLGVYIVAGNVAKEIAGPAACISFLIAAFACILSAFCYAELASRVPKAGSAYVYSYVTIGEFFAFIIGWILILECVIGTASAARGLSNYIDSLVDNNIRNYFHSVMPMTIPFLSDYPDFFAFSVIFFVTIPVCAGIKKSSHINMFFTSINVLTIIIIIIAGSIKADPANWNIPIESIPASVKNPGTGGFMPFGISGVLLGGAKCFYGYIGFDSITTVGEEAKNPQKNIPLAIGISLIIVFIGYSSISIVLTMMWPYYDQDTDAPFPYVFEQLGWPAIKWVVNIGAIFAISTGLFNGVLTIPRIFYAMASDGLIFKCFAKVYKRTHTPILATLASAFLTALMALLFNLEQLIEMMSIGTLLAYTIVSCCVIILRYQHTDEKIITPNYMPVEWNSFDKKFKRIFNLYNNKLTTDFSSRVATFGVIIFAILSLAFGLIFREMIIVDDTTINVIGYLFCITIVLMIALTIIAIGRQPNSTVIPPFQVPCVPLLPCSSIFINLILMLQLEYQTWIRLFIWVLIGIVMYFCYGIRNSRQGLHNKYTAELHTQQK